MNQKKILVIKHSALGDFVLSLGPFKAIRDHHPNDEITLLTTKAFKDLAEATCLFNDIWIDTKPKFIQIKDILRLRKRILSKNFDRIYDLQTSGRSSLYYKFFISFLKNKTPEWNGIAKGCSHPQLNPDRVNMHTIERHKDQLKYINIHKVPPTYIDWMSNAKPSFNKLNLPYFIIVPGGSAHREEKRWSLSSYKEISSLLSKKGYDIVIVGTDQENSLAKQIQSDVPKAINLCGKTNIIDLFHLGLNAEGAIGNDTGPMHIFALTDCPTLTLFSEFSDPVKCRPRSPNGYEKHLQFTKDYQLSVEEVKKNIIYKSEINKNIVV